MSATLILWLLLRVFFIVCSFVARGESRTDYPNHTASLNIHHCEQSLIARKTQQREPFFPERMTWISHNATQGIAEDRRRPTAFPVPSISVPQPDSSDLTIF